MRVRGVAGNEDAAVSIRVGDGVAQLPEARIVDLAGEIEAGGRAQRRAEIEILALGVARDRRVEEEPLADIDAAEELPVTLEVRVQHAVSRARRKALQCLVELARPEHDQHHQLVEIGAAARDAAGLADHRSAAVATHGVVRSERRGLLRRLVCDRHTHAVGTLRYVGRLPAEPRLDRRQRRQFCPQHLLHPVLRHAVVVLEVIGPHQFASARRVPVIARQIAIGRDLANRRIGRHDARAPQFVDDAPRIEMLERALRQVLPLGNPMHAVARLDQHAGNAAHPERHGKPGADRAAADDGDFGIRLHAMILIAAGRRFGQRRWTCPSAQRRTSKSGVEPYHKGGEREVQASHGGSRRDCRSRVRPHRDTTGRARRRLSEPRDPHHRALPARRPERQCGADHPALPVAETRTAGGHREQVGSQRHHRHRRGRQGAARWLHTRRGRLVAHCRAGNQRPHAVRHRARSRCGQPADARPAAVRDRHQAPGQHAERFRGAGQSATRQA